MRGNTRHGRAERNVETEKRQHKGESGHRSVNLRPDDPFFYLEEKANLALGYFIRFIKIAGKLRLECSVMSHN